MIFLLNISRFVGSHQKTLGDHYENTPMQYTVIFHGCKNLNFQKVTFFLFLLKTLILGTR